MFSIIVKNKATGF